ncbi:proline-rich receptor-like protein kinase PERK10 [Terrapene carolina triunguis]|uniref:proline-rich receptor-like protein kinase PERK10 n=1 Tax=Terrapene triunguis TaxID=2587831 RepID=UPI0011566B8B|nr:proline-rich receptor-like protein kinase PERK10 [Terrapene carolina triunguis]
MRPNGRDPGLPPTSCHRAQENRPSTTRHSSCRTIPMRFTSRFSHRGTSPTTLLLLQQPGTPSTFLLSQPTRDPHTAPQQLHPSNTPPHIPQSPQELCAAPQPPRDVSPVLLRSPDTPPAHQQLQPPRDGSPVLQRLPDTPPALQQSPPLRVDSPDPQQDVPTGDTPPTAGTPTPQGTDGNTIHLTYPPRR